MKNLFLLSVVAFSLTTQAQEFDSLALKYSNEIKETSLQKHLNIIASDEYEGRETGKKGQKMTMEYLINEFKSYGIADYNSRNYQQSFPLIEQENSGIQLKLGDQELEMFVDFVVSPSFIENQSISGEINFFNGNQKEENIFIWKADTAKDYLMSIREQSKQLKNVDYKTLFYYDDRLTRNLEKYEHYYRKSRTRLESELKEGSNKIKISLSDSGKEKLFAAAGVKDKKLEKKGVDALKGMSLNFSLEINKPNNKISGENVLAYIEGSDKKDELIVITAHYDHLGIDDSLVYNGADDDGTGTVSLLEIAESFKLAQKAGHGPRRSILIMPVSGEEKGLLGSKYYTDHPVFPLENTVANLNIDMIGRYDENHTEDSNYVYLIGSDRLSMDLHNISETVNKNYMQFNLDYTFNEESDPNRFYYRSDHYNFAKNNIPVIFYFSGVHEDYHQATDTVEKIDFKKTARIAKLVFLTAWELANREERIQLIEEKGGTN